MENPFVIEDREELIFMLSEAAALEHMVMCGYLYAAFSLKQSAEENVTEEQLQAIKRWNRTITRVATQEMLHLALVNNLLSSIGAAPYFDRPNFPQRSKYFPPRIQMALLPFGEQALRHFLFLERPEGMELEDAAVLGAQGFEVHIENAGDDLVPQLQDFGTVGHLYRGIEKGLQHLVSKYGEQRLFVGPPKAQITKEYFGWPELVQVTDLASAIKAIETIVTEGEGARGNWKNAHYGKFYSVLNEYLELKKNNPAFEPARPVVPAFVKEPSDVAKVDRISDPFTLCIANVFNAAYELMLQMLSRVFMHAETTDPELHILSDCVVDLMLKAVKPFGEYLSALPIGQDKPNATVGPVFEMYRRAYLLPHRHGAWIVMHERLIELADYCSYHRKKYPNPILNNSELLFRELAQRLEPHLHTV